MRSYFIQIYKGWLYNTKLKHKILLTYLALIILPLGIFQYVASDKIADLIVDQITYSAEQGFDQTYSYFSYRVERIAKTTDILLTNPAVSSSILELKTNHNINKELQEYDELKRLLISVRDNLDIAGTVMYVPETFLFANEMENFLPISLADNSSCFQRLKMEKQKYMWCTADTLAGYSPTDDASFISVARNIMDPNDYQSPIGHLRVDVEKEKLRMILNKANVVKNSVTFLHDSTLGVILASDSVPADLVQPLADVHLRDETNIFTSGENYYFTRPVPSSQWSMVTVIPLDEVVKQGFQLRNQLYLLLFAIAAAAYLVAYLLAISITRRISRLTSRIREVEIGNMLPLSPIDGRDEVGELIRTYNFMIKKISAMNEQQFRLGQERKSAELKALQSQINPHFLYNTLDLINWMATRGMNNEIKNVVKTLSRFYRVSLSNGRDIITLKEELDHVTFYVQIQNIRYDYEIEFHIRVPEDMYTYLIPKITLQPLVENAIAHGILGRESRKGKIEITAAWAGNDILITVSDNGIGMDEDQLAKLNDHFTKPGVSDDSYGSRNVDMRIRHYFGKNYGLTYNSMEGRGTSVDILISAEDVLRNDVLDDS
ncbi:sensor histidine kinase [Paenibacillus sp. LHD-117]|uniref:cache domain-containing sensor histidine kinase n=1 Tax=Paenibacillus sp. LHD-117 TaxID=3071412 RepID=UPI0027E1206D|nr:sensor histidine kinase [Paenibacillus sp. LHD-117]MDQ6422978.1 sensor histidine kinase [Paenibacillus sp. LHD-117]